ncbi:S9 family peptidase [Fibrisoma limi]|nr:S9 family peptidase [Fibrisoma limi]
MIHYKRVSNPVITEDGKWVTYVVSSPRMEGEQSDFLSHIHLVSVDGTIKKQLTAGDKSCTNPRFSPDGQYISFTSGRNGTNQLYLIRPTGGDAWPITAQSGNIGAYRWSPDGKRIAFIMIDPRTPADEKDRLERRDWTIVDVFRNAHLYTIDLTQPQDGSCPVKQLTNGAFHVTAFNWSPDSRTIAFSHQPVSWAERWEQQNISTVAADSGAVRLLVSTNGADYNPLYSPDGESIAFLSEGGQPDPLKKAVVTTGVYLVPAQGGAVRKLATTPDERSTLLGWTPDNRSIVVTEALGTQTGVFLLPATGDGVRALPIPEKGIQQAHFLNRKGDLAYVYETTETPIEVYTASLANPTGHPLTDIHASYAEGQTLARTELMRWKARDGKYTIESLLTYPTNYQSNRRYPLLLMIHGGPLGNWTQTYTGANYAPGLTGSSVPYPIQAFAQQGYFVLWANPRGSTGYGHAFRAAVYRNWSEGPYQDLMTGIDKLISTGVVHPDSLVVSGWSYGGYLTALMLTKTNRFKAAMAGAAITNLMSDVGTTDIPYYVAGYFGKDFWNDPTIYAEQSPLFHVKQVQTPTLIIHGSADMRVPPEQGLQFYRALQQLGVPTQMVIYPRQPHAFTEPKFIQNAGERTIEWFNKYLGRK